MPTVDEILRGTSVGARQSVGNMDVIPLVDDDGEDPFFSAPDFDATTNDYGRVHLRNNGDGPSIVPPGTGFVTNQAAQDHAVTSGGFVKKGENKTFENACCIQETQGGLISKGAEMIMLPAPLRAQAIATRNSGSYDRLWSGIRAWKESMGLHGAGNLVDYLKVFKKELDQFVAEFELVPHQVGAIVLVNGKIAGIERAPTASFWETLWEPMIRGCYGSLSLQTARLVPPGTKSYLEVRDRSLDGLRTALREAAEADQKVTDKLLLTARKHELLFSGETDDKLGRGKDQAKMSTLASQKMSGQVVERDGRIVFASMCTARA